MEFRGIEQDLIPYVGQLKLPNVPIEELIIDPDVHSLIDGTCDAVHLPTHNGEVFLPGMMTCCVGMVIGRERVLRYSLSLSLKVLADSPIYSSSHSNLSVIPVYYCTLLCDVILVLCGHQ